MCLVGSRTYWKVLLLPFFELVNNQTIQTFSTSQEILLSVLFLWTKRHLRIQKFKDVCFGFVNLGFLAWDWRKRRLVELHSIGKQPHIAEPRWVAQHRYHHTAHIIQCRVSAKLLKHCLAFLIPQASSLPFPSLYLYN